MKHHANPTVSIASVPVIAGAVTMPTAPAKIKLPAKGSKILITPKCPDCPRYVGVVDSVNVMLDLLEIEVKVTSRRPVCVPHYRRWAAKVRREDPEGQKWLDLFEDGLRVVYTTVRVARADLKEVSLGGKWKWQAKAL